MKQVKIFWLPDKIFKCYPLKICVSNGMFFLLHFCLCDVEWFYFEASHMPYLVL